MTHPPSARLVTETALIDALDSATDALNLGTASTHPASDFDPAGAASTAQAAATAAAALDATSKASAAQAAAISAAASDATTKASAAQSAATSAAATDATTKANAVAAQLGNYVARSSAVGAYTYDGNGNVTATPDGTTYTWESDGAGGYRVKTETVGAAVRTFSYAGDGSLASVA